MGVSNPPHPMEMGVVYRDKYVGMGEGGGWESIILFFVGHDVQEGIHRQDDLRLS